ncbi:HSP20 family protein [Saccharopolyspora lacisalsi]|uniref:HSP20 family protein n=1 Tax=Halosaccharopolyspora lacisalsi TaxID=1000566 RepID=A0A839DZ52_9PSEU|nr:Hsp20/alpha crystallin family protein [Halosaccharopolyspora lacisalsi]MBA8826273.1 HSP20 family protein [Halosaccharopolyspora lacisalsi]
MKETTRNEPLPARTGHHAARRMPDRGREPFREVEELRDRPGRGFDPGSSMSRGGAWQPMVDVEETEDAYFYEAEPPGVARDDITVDVNDNELSISGEMREEESNGVLHHQMRRTGHFSHRSALPQA